MTRNTRRASLRAHRGILLASKDTLSSSELSDDRSALLRARSRLQVVYSVVAPQTARVRSLDYVEIIARTLTRDSVLSSSRHKLHNEHFCSALRALVRGRAYRLRRPHLLHANC